jgi:hypothetical protein
MKILGYTQCCGSGSVRSVLLGKSLGHTSDRIQLKKISSKLGAMGIKRSEILRCFQKCVDLLRQEVSTDFLSEKSVFL